MNQRAALLGNDRLKVSTKLITQRRKHAVGENIRAAGAEARVERRTQHRRGHRLVDCGLDGPAALARVRHAACELRQLGVVEQRPRGQIEQLRADHAAAPPDLGHIAQMDVILISPAGAYPALVIAS